jgi:hypothetical protein
VTRGGPYRLVLRVGNVVQARSIVARHNLGERVQLQRRGIGATAASGSKNMQCVRWGTCGRAVAGRPKSSCGRRNTAHGASRSAPSTVGPTGPPPRLTSAAWCHRKAGLPEAHDPRCADASQPHGAPGDHLRCRLAHAGIVMRCAVPSGAAAERCQPHPQRQQGQSRSGPPHSAWGSTG